MGIQPGQHKQQGARIQSVPAYQHNRADIY